MNFIRLVPVVLVLFVLAACGGGGGSSSVPEVMPEGPTAEELAAADAARTAATDAAKAATDAAAAAQAAVDAATLADTMAAQAAADAATAAAKAASDAAAAVDASDPATVAAANTAAQAANDAAGAATTATTALNTAEAAAVAAAAEAERIRAAAAAVRAEGIEAAIDEDSERPDADPGNTGDQLPFTVDKGKVTTTVPNTPDNTDDDLAKSDDAPASINGWQGATYTRTTEAASDGSTPEVRDTVVAYTDVEAAGPLAYSVYYSTSDASSRAGVSSADGDGVLTLSTDQTGNHDLFSLKFGITAEHQTIPIDHDDPATEDVTETESEFMGMFNGISGTFKCTGTCSVVSDGMENLITLNGTWTFTPDDVADMVQGVDPDDDYMDFGYWLRETDGDDGTTYGFTAFAQGARDYGSVASVEGSATYTGPATGLYSRKTFDRDGNETHEASGQFTADTELNATFGGTSVPADDHFTISGSVSNFMDSNGDPISAAWSVNLMRTTIDQGAGTYTGAASGGGAAGVYEGTFHGDNTDDAQPSSTSGTFDGHFGNGHVRGAFGASK